MLCQSVRSFHSPLCLSLKLSLVAMLNLVTAVPCGVYLSSGSLPSVPIRMTLLTLFAMGEGSPLLGLCDAQYIRGAGRAESLECGSSAAKPVVEHEIDKHPSGRDIEPYRTCETRDAAMRVIAGAEPA